MSVPRVNSSLLPEALTVCFFNSCSLRMRSKRNRTTISDSFCFEDGLVCQGHVPAHILVLPPPCLFFFFFFFFIHFYLSGCAESLLLHVGSLVAACGISLVCGMWDLDPWPEIEPQALCIGSSES